MSILAIFDMYQELFVSYDSIEMTKKLPERYDTRAGNFLSIKHIKIYENSLKILAFAYVFCYNIHIIYGTHLMFSRDTGELYLIGMRKICKSSSVPF